jgi:hypothetical protein
VGGHRSEFIPLVGRTNFQSVYVYLSLVFSRTHCALVVLVSVGLIFSLLTGFRCNPTSRCARWVTVWDQLESSHLARPQSIHHDDDTTTVI